MRKFAIALTIAAACLAATPALAGDAKLAWNDLDLTTEAGKAELDNRIDAAAHKLCTRDQPVTGRILRGAPTARCLAEARELITARIAARTGPERFAAAPVASGGATGEAR